MNAEKFWAWLARRNGPDAFFFVVFALFGILLFLGALLQNWIMLLLAALPLGYAAFRFFSGNLPRRRGENLRFIKIGTAPYQWLLRLIKKMRRKQNASRTLDEFIYCSCPACTAPLRLKRKTGEFSVTCPKCSHKFPIHIR